MIVPLIVESWYDVTKTSKWRIKKNFTKVAEKGSIIMNVAPNILPVEEAIQKSSLYHPLFPIQDLVSEIDRLVQLATIQITIFYPDVMS